MSNITSLQIGQNKISVGLIPDLENPIELDLNEIESPLDKNFYNKVFQMPFDGFVKCYSKSSERIWISISDTKINVASTLESNHTTQVQNGNSSGITIMSNLVKKGQWVGFCTSIGTHSSESITLYHAKGL